MITVISRWRDYSWSHIMNQDTSIWVVAFYIFIHSFFHSFIPQIWSSAKCQAGGQPVGIQLGVFLPCGSPQACEEAVHCTGTHIALWWGMNAILSFCATRHFFLCSSSPASHWKHLVRVKDGLELCLYFLTKHSPRTSGLRCAQPKGRRVMLIFSWHSLTATIWAWAPWDAYSSEKKVILCL